MKKIEAIIRPMRLEIVKSALGEAGITGMTVSDVRGCGRQGPETFGSFRGEEYIIRLPSKIRLELTVPDDEVDRVLDIIVENARTGQEGDGKIFVYDLDSAVRIRTGEKDKDAL